MAASVGFAPFSPPRAYSQGVPAPTSDRDFRALLTGEHPGLAGNRRLFKRLPSPPRCKLCAAPFAGPGGAVMRRLGFARFPGNPAICRACIAGFVRDGLASAEIPVSLLFADIRGSTGLGERLAPTAFRDFLVRFYGIASETILDHDGLVDKLVGDEVIGLFFGGVTGPRHAAAAVAAASDWWLAAAVPMRRRWGRSRSGRRCTPAWPSWVRRDRRARSTTSRRSATRSTRRPAWRPRRPPVSCWSAWPRRDDAGDVPPDAERRTLDVRGREATIDVVVLRPT